MEENGKLICEICGEEPYQEIFLPDAEGWRTVRSGLVFCRRCRIVMYPSPPAPPMTGRVISHPNMQKGIVYGPREGVK